MGVSGSNSGAVRNEGPGIPPTWPEAIYLLELHLEFIDGGRRAFAEHPGLERAALVGLNFWLRRRLGRSSDGPDEMRYFNGPQGGAIPIHPASVRNVELQLGGQDVGGRVLTGEIAQGGPWGSRVRGIGRKP